MLCDGSAVSRTNYADLFAVIGTTYGAGDGSTTFNLLLLTDNRFIEGSNSPGIQREAGLPNITGKMSRVVSTGIEEKSGALAAFEIPSVHYTGASGGGVLGLTFDASKSNSIYSASTTVQPPALTMLPIIKY